MGLTQEWGVPVGHVASLAAAKCSPSSCASQCSAAALRGGQERSEKLASHAGKAAHLADLGTWRMLWPSTLGLGQSPLHTGGIKAWEHCSLGCWMGAWLHLFWWKTPNPGHMGCEKEFILEAGMRGVPNLSDLPKAI